VSFLRSRLRRVEQRARGGSCPECGLSPNSPGRIVISDSEGFPDNPDEHCASCGRPLWCVIQIVYDDEAKPGGGAIGYGTL
jgi:hypothetical protein